MTVDIIPRTAWQESGMPVVGPSMVLSMITMVPAHYTAASSVPSDTASYLRAIQRDYTLNRGYSIGYNFAVDQTGQAWECRGFDIKCAANKGANDVTIAVLCLVDGAEAMNDAMCATFCALGAEAEQRCADSLLVVGHRDIGATACPGDGIYAQVGAGLLEPNTEPEPTPTPPPTPEEDDDMVPFIITNTATGQPALVYADGLVTGLSADDFGKWVARFGDALPCPPDVFNDFAGKV